MKRTISKERLAGILLFVLVVAAIVSIVFNSITQTRGLPPLEPLKPPLTKGTAAPQFELESLTGEKVSLEQFKGKPVLIMFWSAG